MSNLIITIIAISLAVVVATMGANYINTDIVRSKEYQHEAEAGFLKLKVAYDLYLMYNQSKLDTASDLANQVNSVRGPSLTGDMMPKKIKNNFDWSYGNSGSDYYFCLLGSYNKTAMMGFKKMNNFEKEKAVGQDYMMYINNACGANTDDLTINTGPLAVTYWITR